MKITSIESQKNKNRVNIYIDNKFSFGISEELRFKYGLRVDEDITDEFIMTVLKSEEQMKVTGHALNLLSYRQRSENELYKALKRKGYEDIYIDTAIDYLRENRYVDDSNFARSFINDKVNLNKLGSKRIKYELINKGVPMDIIENTLHVDKNTEYEMALGLATKKISSYKNQDRNTIYRKLSGFLQRKGYPYDIVSKVLRELLKD